MGPAYWDIWSVATSRIQFLLLINLGGVINPQQLPTTTPTPVSHSSLSEKKNEFSSKQKNIFHDTSSIPANCTANKMPIFSNRSILWNVDRKRSNLPTRSKKLRRIFEAETFNLQDKNLRLKNVQQRLTDATKWCWTFCLSEWSSFYLNIVQWINALWLSSSDLYPYSLLLSFNSLNIT